MTIGPYYFNSGSFPTQGGAPVTITENQFVDCCCIIEEFDLIALYPHQAAPHGFYPYPDGMLYIGPYAVPVKLIIKSDNYCYFDDYAAGGIVDAEEWPPGLIFDYFYGSYTLIDPLPIGATYRFTIISTQATKVGVDPMFCTYVKIMVKRT